MHKKFRKHSAYYISLFIVLMLGLVLVVLSSPNLRLQSIIICLTILSYVLLGALHHLINHELTHKIMVEYILIGLLGMSILFFILIGGSA